LIGHLNFVLSSWSLDQAFVHTKAKRAIIQPNNGFWTELQVYEGMIRASVNKVKLEDQDPQERLKRVAYIADFLELIAGAYKIYNFQLESRFHTLENLRKVKGVCDR